MSGQTAPDFRRGEPMCRRPRPARGLTLSALLTLAACAVTQPAPVDVDEHRRAVWDTELAFAATMAARDHQAFRSFLADEAVFLTTEDTLRGGETVAAGWKPLFEGDTPPFSWRPDRVEVLDSGDLALSTGPVIAPDGTPLGRFTSIWRRDSAGWRVVFDKPDGG